MPDAITPVGTMYPPVNPLAALSSIIDIRQKQQNLQTGQYQQQTAQAESDQAQQKNSQLTAAAKAAQGAYTSGQFRTPTGDFDSAKFSDFISSLGPYAQGMANDITMRAGETYKNQQTLFNLQTSKREQVANMFGALAADPTTDHTKMINAVEDLRQQYPGDKDLSRLLTSVSTAMPNTSGQPLQQALRNAAVAANAPSATQTNPSTGTFQGASGIQPYQSNPQAVGGVKNIGAPLGPQGYAPQPTQMPNGSIATTGSGFGYPGAGGASGPRQGPRTAAQDAPPANAPKAVQDAYQQAVSGVNSHVDAVRTADESYGNNMAIANTIRELSKSADTGPGTKTWNQVMGVLGTNKANNAQELGAFLDRQAATVRGQMGLPGTNAGAEDAKSIVGNTGYNPKVIQDKNDYTQALTEGLHQYRNGLDRVAGFSGQASPAAVNAYKAAWAQNFDPNIYKGELAFKRSPAEGAAFVKSLAPQEAASLAAKRAALQKLSQGQMP